MKSTATILCLILFSFSFSLYAQGDGYSYLPTARTDDDKFFCLIGPGSSSHIGAEVYEFALEISYYLEQIEIGVFDGQQGGYWDSSWGTPPPVIFTLYADPNGDGTNMIKVGEWSSYNMPDNDWYACLVPTDERARLENGNFGYRLLAGSTKPKHSRLQNNFKLRVNGAIEMIPFSVGFMAHLGVDYYHILYPEAGQFPDGPYDPTTYDGVWEWFIYLPEPVEALEIWDGDFDHGSYPPHDYDTDDPDTPNDQSPPWAGAGVETRREGENPGAPQDNRPNDPWGWYDIYKRGASVIYKVIDPNGKVYMNDNPSGNSEWERFRIDTAPFDRSKMDHHADELPAGIYTIRVEGLDIYNYNALRFDRNVVGHNHKGKPIVFPILPPNVLSTIGDLVWVDKDKDGIPDPDEPPLANVNLALYNEQGNKIAKARTDENGNYLFKNVPAGTYQVVIDDNTVPQDYNLTTYSSVLEVSVQGGQQQLSADYGYVNKGEPGCKELFAWLEPWFGDTENEIPLRHWTEDLMGGITDSAWFNYYQPYQDPVPNLYDSKDPDLIKSQILQAWTHEIDAFVIDWMGKDSFEQQSTQLILDQVAELYDQYKYHGFDFRVILSYNENAAGTLEENLRFIADSIFTHKAYYNNQFFNAPYYPLFVYSPDNLLQPQQLWQTLGQVTSDSIQLIWNWQGDPTDPLLDQVTSVYPWAGEKARTWDHSTGLEWGKDYLNQFYQLSDPDYLTGAVWPGFDDRQWSNGNGLWTDRQQTAVYDSTWQNALKSDSKWILLQSWNDYNRNTHVELSHHHETDFLLKTRTYGMQWKGAKPCCLEIDELALPFPTLYYVAAKSGIGHDLLEASVQRFFEGNYAGAIALLETGVMETEYAGEEKEDNDLVFIKGTQTLSKGDKERGWHNAVDGDLEGWDGTTWAKGEEHKHDPAWAVFRFADNQPHTFNYITFQTDNGTADDADAAAQVERIEVLVSTGGLDEEDFVSVWEGRRKYDGTTLEWRRLASEVTAKYVKLVLYSQYYNAGWRQIVEFQVQSDDKKGAKPAQALDDLAAMPKETALNPGYPNPFNPVTTISYTLAQSQPVQLIIYDSTGRTVQVLANGMQQAGTHRIDWNAAEHPSGVYFARLQTTSQNFVQKLTLLK
jgi:hypothetical protein